MSDPLDIVDLIDAKVAKIDGTVARSKRVAVSAKEDLGKHERWLERQRGLCAEDAKRHKRRLKRRRAFAACKQMAKYLVLLVPSICVASLRGSISALVYLRDTLRSCWSWIDAKDRALWLWLCGVASWIGGSALAIGRSLSRLFWLGFRWIGVKDRALGLWLIALLSRSLAWMGAKAHALGLWLIALLSRSLSWTAPKAHALGLWLIDRVSRSLSSIGAQAPALREALVGLLSFAASRTAVAAHAFGLALAHGIGRGWAQLILRLGSADAAREGARDARPLNNRLAEHRLKQAAFARMRAEHERLQKRIHALDKLYGRRAASGVRGSGAANQDWAQLRTLALNAQRLFETQDGQVRGLVPARGNGRPGVANGTAPSASLHALKTGQAVYGAPALIGARQPLGRTAPRPARGFA